MKLLCVAIVLMGYCTSLISAGSYYYNNQLVPTAPPPPPPQYLPNYDVLPPQEYEVPVNYNSWGHGPTWKPITNFPWPGPDHGPHYHPHHHHGAGAPPCPNKMKMTTPKYTTTTTHTTTTTTHRPVETKKPHLLEKLAVAHPKGTH